MSQYTGNASATIFANVLAQPFQWGPTSTSLTAIFITFVIIVLSTTFRSSSDDSIHKLGGFSLLNTWSFFSKRYDFLRKHFNKTGAKMFRFTVLQHRVIAMAGEANRKIFFTNGSFDVAEGYRIFSGGIPSIEDIQVDDKEVKDIPEVLKRLLLLLRKERVAEVIPLLLKDINRRMKDWGTEGRINPFNEVYELVFQMTVRFTSCRELADNGEAVVQLSKHYWDIEQNVTTATIILPWFPSSAKKAKEKATMALYSMLLSYVSLRRKSSTPTTDPIDLFISQEVSDNGIVETIMGTIFVGVVNTGVNSCWALLHLGTNPKWKRKAIDEYKALVDKYTIKSSDPLHVRLSTIPLSAWEDELPSVDAIIRETLRLSGSGTFLRRNLAKDVRIGAATIKRGDFVVYSAADVHLNPDIYANPMIFDPDRYGPGHEEDRKEAFGYLSWGAGRHPCMGTKMARLEIKLILAMILLGYEYELVDGKGNYPKRVPDQDRNDFQKARPIGEPCYLKFKRTVE